MLFLFNYKPSLPFHNKKSFETCSIYKKFQILLFTIKYYTVFQTKMLSGEKDWISLEYPLNFELNIMIKGKKVKD